MGKKRELISQAEYARRRGVKPPTINNYVKTGVIKLYKAPKSKKKLVDPAQADAAIAEYNDPSRDSKIKKAIPGPAAKDPEDNPLPVDIKNLEYLLENIDKLLSIPEARKYRENVKLQLDAIELREKKKELIDAKEYEAFIEKVFVALRSRLLALPTKIAPRLEQCTTLSERKRILDDSVYECLTELSQLKASSFVGGEEVKDTGPAPAPKRKRVGGRKKKAQPRK